MIKLKQIKGFENYHITENGQIYSNHRQSFGKAKKTKVNNKGYVMVTLYKDKKEYTKYLHRLLAENFLENPNCYAEVNHKDGNKLNNKLDNLEWCSISENRKHCRRVLLKNTNPIKVLMKNGEEIDFNFMIECSEWLGIRNSTLSNILNGYRKKPSNMKDLTFLYKGYKI